MIGFKLFSIIESVTRLETTIIAASRIEIPKILGINNEKIISEIEIIIKNLMETNQPWCFYPDEISQAVLRLKTLVNINFCVHDFSGFDADKKTNKCIHCGSLFEKLDNKCNM